MNHLVFNPSEPLLAIGGSQETCSVTPAQSFDFLFLMRSERHLNNILEPSDNLQALTQPQNQKQRSRGRPRGGKRKTFPEHGENENYESSFKCCQTTRRLSLIT